MFNKSYLAALLFSMLTVSSIAEETPNSAEIEALSPILQCDKQYEICSTKCDEMQSIECLDACEARLDKCYDASMSQTDDAPSVEYQENEPDTTENSDQENESESIPDSEGTEQENDSEYTTPPVKDEEG
jgi:hypothetical protein